VKGCCPLDCPDSCAWTAHVEDGRVVRVEGVKEHPFTRGVLCAKVRDYESRLTAPGRLLHPLRRIGAKGEGRFERISWEAALGEIASRFRTIISGHGAEALLPLNYLGSMGVVQRHALMRIFHALGASSFHGNVCGQSAGVPAGEGHPIGMDPEETPEAELIILWGQNVLSTGHHHWHFIEAARKRRGAKVIAIDPRATRTTRLCDRHLAIRPGSDAVLAAAIGRVLLGEGLADLDLARLWVADLDAYRAQVEPWTPGRAAPVTGIAAEEIIDLARAFGRARPALIRAGIAPMQTVHGEAFVRALSAIAILGGHWRHQGGGLSILGGPPLDESKVARPDLRPGSPRSLDMARLGEHLDSSALAPPVMGLMVWSANPAATQIDAGRVRRGLARADLFTVVHDHFLTDTARFADIVLPATTQLEHFDLQGSWSHEYVSVNLPAVAPMGEAWSGGAVMRGLAAALGLSHPALAESDEEIAAPALPAGWSMAGLKADGYRKLPAPRPAIERRGTLLRLAVEPVVAPAPAAAGELQLLTPKSHYFLNSTFANMPRHRTSQGAPTIEVSASDAEAMGLADGASVIVASGLGRVHARLRVTAGLRPGVASLEGKWWSAPADTAAELNMLTPSRWSPAGQPAYNETYVRIEAVAAEPDRRARVIAAG
jgi:anaerobic selenocysteine-containing dehydrogenase